MRKAQTRKLITRAQGAAGVLLLAAGALALAPLSWGSGGGERPVFRSRASGEPMASAAGRMLDEHRLAGQLRDLAVPMDKERLPAAPKELAAAEAATPVEPKTVWEYIGGMIGPGTRKAIVSLSGSQRLVAEGDVVADTRVNAITADFIVIEEKGVETKIDRKNKQERVALASSAGKNGKGGMDPASMSAARQALMNQTGMAHGGSSSRRKSPNDPPPGKIDDPSAKMGDQRAKLREAYMDAMRENNNQPLEPASLPKFGLENFVPTPEEIDQMTNQIKNQTTTSGG